LIAAALALGAVQAAAVAAQPIPKYEKGTKSAKGGIALVSERGPELAFEPGGKAYLTPAMPSLLNVKRGTEIIPADITNQMLKYAAIKTAMPDQGDETIGIMAHKLDKIERAIRKQPVASSTMTPGGILTAVTRGNTTTKNLDRYFK